MPDLLAKTGGPLFKLPKELTGAIFDLEKLFKFTGVGALSGIFDFLNKGATGDNTASGLAHLAELQAKYAASTLKNGKKLTTEELKQLKAKQLKLAIDKANLALGKGENVFDMEKIQLAAAEKNQAEQLGKITSQAQLLQITNDLARLEIKQSILALEEAIASQDVPAITAATNKLNADLKVLGALTGQKIKLTEIKDILAGILPKDLINLANLDAAIAKLKTIGGATGSSTSTSSTSTSSTSTSDFIAPINPILASTASIDAILEYADAATARANAMADLLDAQTAAAATAFASSPLGKSSNGTTIVVNVNAGTIANPEQLTTMVQDAVISLNKRGDLLTYAGSL